jgi:short-subunit dehydrogenase
MSNMTIRAGQTVLLTGASGGLGTYMAEAFAERGVQLALVAYPGIGLESLRDSIRKKGGRAIAINADLRDPNQRQSMLEQVRSEFGEIHVLVNNAGIEFTSIYHDLSVENIRDVLNVNLEAPMVLTRLILPEMLRRNSGHIVNISSLAAKATPAYQEPYVASKAGLIAFTYSLRATYRSTGVGASVIVPGFVEAGIYANLKARSGLSAPTMLGTSKPEPVARAVIRAIERNLPEVIINPLPVRPLLAFNAMFPSAGEWMTDKLGGNKFFQSVAEKIRGGKK